MRRNVIQIVAGGLRIIGADGLFDGDECGCHIDDLAPCGQIGSGCVAARNDPKRAKDEGCDHWMVPLDIDDHVEVVDDEESVAVCEYCDTTDPESHDLDCPTCEFCGAIPHAPHYLGCANAPASQEDEAPPARTVPLTTGGVQRYAYFPEGIIPRIQGCPDGEWVKHSDFAGVVAERDALKAEVETLRGTINLVQNERDEARGKLAAAEKQAADHCEAMAICYAQGMHSRDDEVRSIAARLEEVERESAICKNNMERAMEGEAAALAKLAEVEGERVPADCDARKILLQVYNTLESDHEERYAKNVGEVEEEMAKLAEHNHLISELVGRIARALGCNANSRPDNNEHLVARTRYLSEQFTADRYTATERAIAERDAALGRVGEVEKLLSKLVESARKAHAYAMNTGKDTVPSKCWLLLMEFGVILEENKESIDAALPKPTPAKVEP